MSSSFYRLVCLLVVLGACLPAQAQGTRPASAPALTEPSVEQVPKVPGVGIILRGFNAGIAFSGVHDSSIGWYTVATPAVSYSFSPHYSADASLSIYPYRLVENPDPIAASTERLVADLGEAGDTLIGLHASFNPRLLRNMATASFTIPTGNRWDGLGTGKVTFDFADHLERYFKQTGFLVDLGAGDSSVLFNRLVTNDYTSLGPLAHFQAGIAVWLPGHSSIQSVAYEQLPAGSQKVYTVVGPPGLPNLTVTSSPSASEDNGFTTSVEIPLNAHVTLSSYYNRSLRRQEDTVSMGMTFVFRGTERSRKLSMIDRALREAEGPNR